MSFQNPAKGHAQRVRNRTTDHDNLGVEQLNRRQERVGEVGCHAFERFGGVRVRGCSSGDLLESGRLGGGESCCDRAPKRMLAEHGLEAAPASALAQFAVYHGGRVRDVAATASRPGTELTMTDNGAPDLRREMHVDEVPGGDPTGPLLSPRCSDDRTGAQDRHL